MHVARPIEGDWPHLCVDVTCMKVRRGGRIVPVAVIIALVVNSDARRDVLACMSFPTAHRSMLHSTHRIERLNAEFRRRTGVVGIFPH